MAYPHVGERWRLDIRPTPEYTCSKCGHVRGTRNDPPIFNGMAVEILGESMPRMLICSNCRAKVQETLVKIDLIRNGNYCAVPYTWLASIDGHGLP